jgi:hypothetical protein
MGILHIEGCFFGTIAHKTRIQDSADIATRLRQLYGAPVRSTGRKLWTNIVVDVYNGVRIPKSGEAEKAFIKDVESILATKLVPMRLRVNTETLLLGRALCLTSRGPDDGFVVAPWNVEVGDRIFVAKGSRSPFILRPVDEDTTIKYTQTGSYSLESLLIYRCLLRLRNHGWGGSQRTR